MPSESGIVRGYSRFIRILCNYPTYLLHSYNLSKPTKRIADGSQFLNATVWRLVNNSWATGQSLHGCNLLPGDRLAIEERESFYFFCTFPFALSPCV